MLLPCTSCRRHVHHDERECPFCAAPLDFSGVPEPRLPRGRLSRAATFAFGATMVSATALASCGGRQEQDEDESGGSAGMSSAGTMNVAGGFGLVYGAPPEGGTAGTASGGNANAGNANGGLMTIPVYGAPSDGGAFNTTGGAGGESSGGSAGDTSNGGAGGTVDDGGAGGAPNAGSGGAPP